MSELIVKIFNYKWWKSEPQFENLPDSPADIKSKYLECRRMVRNWFEGFYSLVMHEFEKCGNWNTAVVRSKPLSEISIRSDKYGIFARLDEIRKDGDRVIITDYKTGKYNKMTESIRLQLAVCALAYLDRYEVMPAKVCADFVAYQGGIEEIDVTYDLLDEAKSKIDIHKILTKSTDIRDYPCTCGKCDSEFGIEKDGEGQSETSSATA